MRKNMKYLRVDGNLGKIQHRYFLNTSVDFYCYASQLIENTAHIIS
jgi:hypothetical protein